MADVIEIVDDTNENNPVDLDVYGFKYFSHLNHTNKNVLNQERILKKHLGEDWENIPPVQRDDLINLMFVNEEVRQNYNVNSGSTDIEESFPRLLINMGQKINVDFENELWTWKDEHSGPFSWMSKSQQDLTLIDLDAENILKLQPKQPRVDLEDENSTKKAEQQFTYPCNSWCIDTIKDLRKNEQHIILTPSTSLDLEPGRSIEEVNLAFEKDTNDIEITAVSDFEKTDSRGSSVDKDDTDNSSGKRSEKKDRGRKSPSPKKTIINSASFKKSPVRKSDRRKDEKLIAQGHDTAVSEAYCNPAMESEWSTFVGEHIVTDAPETLIMERGGRMVPEVSASSSPYRGDEVQLIQETNDSPAVTRCELPQCPNRDLDHSEWSVESTPDHKTHLLKGIQSPIDATYKMSTLRDSAQHGNLNHSDEVLTVTLDGSDVCVTSQPEKRDSYIPSTGFDFLDNW